MLRLLKAEGVPEALARSSGLRRSLLQAPVDKADEVGLVTVPGAGVIANA